MAELIVRHCAPALAGIKTGNLVNCSAPEALNWMRAVRPLLVEREMDAWLVCFCWARSLRTRRWAMMRWRWGAHAPFVVLGTGAALLLGV